VLVGEDGFAFAGAKITDFDRAEVGGFGLCRRAAVFGFERALSIGPVAIARGLPRGRGAQRAVFLTSTIKKILHFYFTPH
tara:strand:- start:2725 stop:2964 length:240 start_codon:yes stop_codon:yes gene_type:complete